MSSGARAETVSLRDAAAGVLAAAVPAAPAGEPDWLAARRTAAADRFRAHGLPTTRMESWRYTGLLGLDRAAGEGDGSRIDAPAPLRADGWRVVLHDGVLDLAASRLPQVPGIQVLALDEAAERFSALVEPVLARLPGVSDVAGEAAFADLNLAAYRGGIAVLADAGAVLDAPVEIVETGTGLRFGRVLVVLGAGARVTLVERRLSAPGLAILVAEAAVGDGARLDWVRLTEAGDGMNLSHLNARVGAEGALVSTALDLGARLGRAEVAVELAGRAASATVDGGYVLDGRAQCDHVVRIDHRAPVTRTFKNFKGVADGRSRAVFQGKVVVHPPAQGTDARQSSRALLLSDRAEIDAKPELEIYADDVKCSHGATIGDLDRAALFYLRSRGVPEAAARQMLVQAFVADALDSVADEGLRTALAARLSDHLGRPAAEGGA